MDDFAAREHALAASFLRTGDSSDLLILADLYQENGKAWEESLCRTLDARPELRQATHELFSLARGDYSPFDWTGPETIVHWVRFARAEEEAKKRVASGLWHFDWQRESPVGIEFWIKDSGGLPKWGCELRERTELTQDVDDGNGGTHEYVYAVNERTLDLLSDIELGDGDRPRQLNGHTYDDPAGYCRFVEAEMAHSALARETWFTFPDWTHRPPPARPLEVQPAVLRCWTGSREPGGVFALFSEYPGVPLGPLPDLPDDCCLSVGGDGSAAIRRYGEAMRRSHYIHPVLCPAQVAKIEVRARELGIQVRWALAARPGAALRRAEKRKQLDDDAIPF